MGAAWMPRNASVLAKATGAPMSASSHGEPTSGSSASVFLLELRVVHLIPPPAFWRSLAENACFGFERVGPARGLLEMSASPRPRDFAERLAVGIGGGPDRGPPVAANILTACDA